MFDPLQNRFRLQCPLGEQEQSVALSSFRTVERLPVAVHPAIFRVTWDCALCGGEHPVLLSERDLDCGPVMPQTTVTFVNLMTGREESVAGELLDLAERKLRAGSWPWTFYCAEEHDVRPGYPSRIALVSPAGDGSHVGVAVRCDCCGRVSINLVSQHHLDEPFYHDPVLHYVDRAYDPAAASSLDRFRMELWSSRFDEERNRFAA